MASEPLHLVCALLKQADGGVQGLSTSALKPRLLDFSHGHLHLTPLPASPCACSARLLFSVLGVTVVRVYENTFNGTKVHLEGMCTDAPQRSRGIGREMMVRGRALTGCWSCAGIEHFSALN
jgi:hypothetical protein